MLIFLEERQLKMFNLVHDASKISKHKANSHVIFVNTFERTMTIDDLTKLTKRA